MQILATSGGFLPSERGPFQWRVGPLVEHAFELAGRPERPRICYLGTAVGDAMAGTAAFYRAFAGSDVRATHVELFAMPNYDDMRAHLLAQDVVWVGGGSVANLLALWRVHGLDDVFREVWEAGVVLGGVSAGSICWHVGGTTDSFGPELRPVTNGLALVPYSNGVHYDTEPQRRPLFQRLIAHGTLPAGYATDDGAGVLYRGTDFVEAVSERAGATAYFVDSGGETRLDARRLWRG